MTYSVIEKSEVKYCHYNQVRSTVAITNFAQVITDRFHCDTWGFYTPSATAILHSNLWAYFEFKHIHGLINMRVYHYNPAASLSYRKIQAVSCSPKNRDWHQWKILCRVESFLSIKRLFCVLPAKDDAL